MAAHDHDIAREKTRTDARHQRAFGGGIEISAHEHGAPARHDAQRTVTRARPTGKELETHAIRREIEIAAAVGRKRRGGPAAADAHPPHSALVR